MHRIPEPHTCLLSPVIETSLISVGLQRPFLPWPCLVLRYLAPAVRKG